MGFDSPFCLAAVALRVDVEDESDTRAVSVVSISRGPRLVKIQEQPWPLFPWFFRTETVTSPVELDTQDGTWNLTTLLYRI